MTNITDNRKARKKIKYPTYSGMVKRTANKDIGEEITNLEKIKASLLRDSLTQAYETSHLFCVVTLQFVKIHQIN